jgi:ferredoxin
LPDIELDCRPAFSILNHLLGAGVRIRHDCGGKALCGTCRCRPEAPPGALSPIGERERLRLEAVGAEGGERLACQTYARGRVRIELPANSEKIG